MAGLIINEELLQQLELMQTLLKNNNEGMFGGNRKSRSYGSSCEFADYRDYAPGDDITKIDWNAYARFEKLHQKLYYDERQMHTRIYVDASRSMEYGRSEKANQALRLAAAIAYLSVCEMDKVSVYAINGDRLAPVISGCVGKEAYMNSIGAMDNISFEGDLRISDAIVPSNVGRGDGLSVIISDFLTDNDFEKAIDHLTQKRRDLLCIQVLSRDELNPQIRGRSHLFDSEDPERSYRKNIDRDTAKAYREALKYATDRVRQLCESRGGTYLLVPADEPLNKIFFEKLVNTGVVK